MYFVYILLCSNDSLYTGITNNIEKRLDDHKSGKGSKYVRAHLPFKLIHSEEFPDRSSASKRESEIKGLGREEKIRKLKLNLMKF